MENKKKILLLNTGWSNAKRTSANTVCLKRILDKIDDEYKCTVLTNDYFETDEYKVLKEENFDIHHVPSDKYRNYKLLISKNLHFNKILNKLCKKTEKNRYDYYFENLHKESFDYVISISNSFGNIVLGQKIKQQFPEIKWFIYELDSHAFEHTILKFQWIRKKEEKKAFIEADTIFLTKELYSQYKKNEYKIFDKKFVELGLPILENFNHLNKKNDNKKIKFMYAGTFYQKVRNPIGMFKIFSQLVEKNSDVELHLYSNGCQNIVNEYQRKFPENIFIHSHRNNNDILKLLGKSDFLINIGNVNQNQLPSKIFEYMSIGKPIINFAQIKEDNTLPYLKEYGNYFNIEQYDSHTYKNIEKLNDFIINNRNKKVVFDQLSSELLTFSSIEVSNKIKKILVENEMN